MITAHFEKGNRNVVVEVLFNLREITSNPLLSKVYWVSDKHDNRLLVEHIGSGPGIRCTQVKSSVRMKKTHESSK
jgi:hypothetical protein